MKVDVEPIEDVDSNDEVVPVDESPDEVDPVEDAGSEDEDMGCEEEDEEPDEETSSVMVDPR